jgi:hypothetical protein
MYLYNNDNVKDPAFSIIRHMYVNLCEDAEHYIFCCPLFKPQRLMLFAETRIFHPLNVELLL